MEELDKSKWIRLLCALAVCLKTASALNPDALCGAEYCYPGGTAAGNKISTAAASVPPCFLESGADYPTCFAYRSLQGICPFPGMVDCSKVATSAAPATQTSVPTTQAVSVVPTTQAVSAVPTMRNDSGSNHGSKRNPSNSSSNAQSAWPYVVGAAVGLGVAAVISGIIFFVLLKMKKRSIPRTDRYEIDTIATAPSSFCQSLRGSDVSLHSIDQRNQETHRHEVSL